MPGNKKRSIFLCWSRSVVGRRKGFLKDKGVYSKRIYLGGLGGLVTHWLNPAQRGSMNDGSGGLGGGSKIKCTNIISDFWLTSM